MFKVNNKDTRTTIDLRSFSNTYNETFLRNYLLAGGFNPLIVSGTFQPLLTYYGLFRVVPFFISYNITESFD